MAAQRRSAEAVLRNSNSPERQLAAAEDTLLEVKEQLSDEERDFKNSLRRDRGGSPRAQRGSWNRIPPASQKLTTVVKEGATSGVDKQATIVPPAGLRLTDVTEWQNATWCDPNFADGGMLLKELAS